MSPTVIALRGLRLPHAAGRAVTEPLTCMACGQAIAPGQAAIPWAPSTGTFTDWQYLVAPGGTISRHVCTSCAPFLANAMLTGTAKCVVSLAGAWSLSKDSHRAWFLRTPPAPPFVAVVSDRMKQHLLWRAAVTTDANLLRVQLGRRGLRIDRPLLLQAVQWCEKAANLAREAGLRVTPNHPFRLLDRDCADPEHGMLRADIVCLAASTPELGAILAQLAQLGEGELWALSSLAKAKKEEPLAEPLVLRTNK
jgi:CRISPR type IV-associated protein Csf1